LSSQGENRQTLNTLYKLKKEILKSDNDTLVSQIDHAIQKTYNDQLVFSFIGHYSAGKSSLINYLLNQDILPSSPVPTTSNTVSVQIGNKSGIQAFINQYQYAAVDNYEELKALNTKDMDIQAITMDIQSDDYQQNTVFQDTPGVDSNTDSHEEAANRFLLNSDLIFFTVEYNHVESEHNLTLLKEIAGLGIPLVLIINQIDKHDDREITLDTFLNRVKTTLTNWNIYPEHLFTTSIYESTHNHIDDLKAFIKEMEKKRAELEAAYDTRITKNIEDKQLEYLRDELETLTDELQLDNPLTKERAAERIDYLNKEIEKAEINHLRSDENELRSHVKESVKKLVKDSYLFPASGERRHNGIFKGYGRGEEGRGLVR
jgi:GTPase